METTKTPKLSVIIPVYNLEEYIAQCLESIIAQSYEDLEIIAVNDGSTDNTADILKKYAEKDSRIKVISIENGGVSNARNIGINNAVGKYIGFVDGDDYIDLCMYEKMINVLESYDADIVQCGFKLVYDDGRVNDFSEKKEYFFDKKEEIITAIGAQKITNLMCSKVFKRCIIGDIRLHTKLRMAEDLLFVYDCCCNASKIKTVGESYYYYVQRDTSVVHEIINEKKFDNFRVLDLIKERCKSNKKAYRQFKNREIYYCVRFLFDIAESGRETHRVNNIRKRIFCGLYDLAIAHQYSAIDKIRAFIMCFIPVSLYPVFLKYETVAKKAVKKFIGRE